MMPLPTGRFDPAAIPSPEILWARYGVAVMDGALALLGAVLVLIAGLWAADIVAKGVIRFAKKSPQIDDTLGAFFASLARYAIWAFTGVAVLSFFGIDTTSVVAVLGAATLAIGLALQGTLSNVAAGVMLIVFRPYRIGDFVEVAGRRGRVRDVTLFTSELDTLDNVRVVLPNSQCWGSAILNFSANTLRRIDLDVTIGFDADVSVASAACLTLASSMPASRAEPAPIAKVERLSDYGVVLGLRVWTQTENLVALRQDLLERLPRALAEAGTPLAYPTTRNINGADDPAPATKTL